MALNIPKTTNAINGDPITIGFVDLKNITQSQLVINSQKAEIYR